MAPRARKIPAKKTRINLTHGKGATPFAKAGGTTSNLNVPDMTALRNAPGITPIIRPACHIIDSLIFGTMDSG